MSKTKKPIPVYLLVADETPEFNIAVNFAGRIANEHGARLAVLRIFEEPEISIWGDIGRKMHYGYLDEAKDVLAGACDKIIEITGKRPVIYMERGELMEKIIEIIDKDTSITKLILGGCVESKSPGPLVSYFTGKGLSKLRVPLTIVPGNMQAI